MKDMMKEIEDSRQRFLMKHGGSDHAMLGRLPVEPSIDVELQGDRRELIKVESIHPMMPCLVFQIYHF